MSDDVFSSSPYLFFPYRLLLAGLDIADSALDDSALFASLDDDSLIEYLKAQAELQMLIMRSQSSLHRENSDPMSLEFSSGDVELLKEEFDLLSGSRSRLTDPVDIDNLLGSSDLNSPAQFEPAPMSEDSHAMRYVKSRFNVRFIA